MKSEYLLVPVAERTSVKEVEYGILELIPRKEGVPRNRTKKLIPRKKS